MVLSCGKKLSTLLHRITSENKDYFLCLNCLHSFRKSKDFCGIVMPSEKDNILEFSQYMKSDKIPYIIHANIESLIRKNRWVCK